MLASIQNMFDRDLIFAIGEVGETATILTQANVPVVPHVESGGVAVDEEGLMPTAALMLVVRTTALTVTPLVGSLVVYKTRNYRITDIQRHQTEKALTLVLVKDSE